MTAYYWLWRFADIVLILAAVMTLDTFLLPRFRWYCWLRTILFWIVPYTGARIQIGGLPKMEVLKIEWHWRLRDRRVFCRVRWSSGMIQDDWFRLRNVRWLPDWTKI